MIRQVRIGILAASIALLGGCGPVAAGPGERPANASPSIVATAPATTAGPLAAPSSPAPIPTTGAATPAKTPAKSPAAHCGADYYVNTDGKCVHRPTSAPAPPPGASAECNDGTYSFSQHRRGTCSSHGGVKRWLKDLPAWCARRPGRGGTATTVTG